MIQNRNPMILILWSVGLGIFCLMVTWKVEAVAGEQRADVQLLAEEYAWEGFLYRKTAQRVLSEK